jgi:hypothetical protein
VRKWQDAHSDLNSIVSGRGSVKDGQTPGSPISWRSPSSRSRRSSAISSSRPPTRPRTASLWIDLRAEDDALIAAELDAAAAESTEAEDDDEGAEKPARRRRGRRGGRGGRGRRRSGGPLEATFDHGDEGYGLWLDPAVQDDPVYAEYWAGHRPVEVSIEEDQIIIRRAGASDDGDDGDDDED